MYKRYQVLLNEWLADTIKEIAEKYDISFSEVIRVSLCLVFGQALEMSCPKCRYGIDKNEMLKLIKKSRHQKGWSGEDLHQFFSKVYFETRKSMECWGQEQTRQG